MNCNIKEFQGNKTPRTGRTSQSRWDSRAEAQEPCKRWAMQGTCIGEQGREDQCCLEKMGSVLPSSPQYMDMREEGDTFYWRWGTKGLAKLLDQESKDADISQSPFLQWYSASPRNSIQWPRKRYQQHASDISDVPYFPGYVLGPYHMLI